MANDRSREPAGLDGLPELYSILQGEVASVTEYGAFVKIPGYRKHGLVHKNDMSASRVDKPAEMVDVGEKVWIKVIGREITDDKVKLAFSMKSVNQGTGRDLDPNNVMAEQDARRRRHFRDHTNQKITLEAVLNTTCKKCGCTDLKEALAVKAHIYILQCLTGAVVNYRSPLWLGSMVLESPIGYV
ncbi:nucleolar protein of 40 kDa isoform X2 [Trichomycterus rosablanca]|uniref:nucleolar protein of 40 kDa isoform X2 n=1 Tax=Trichomycterus rosablanca TaxID=2290929 RepID=UPI002F35CED9